VFSEYPGLNAIACGTNADAETPLSGDLVEWADVVFVMEKSHRNKVAKKFRELLKGKRLLCLGIADNYACMDPELIRLLKSRVSRHIPIDFSPIRS